MHNTQMYFIQNHIHSLHDLNLNRQWDLATDMTSTDKTKMLLLSQNEQNINICKQSLYKINANDTDSLSSCDLQYPPGPCCDSNHLWCPDKIDIPTPVAAHRIQKVSKGSHHPHSQLNTQTASDQRSDYVEVLLQTALEGALIPFLQKGTHTCN